MVPQPGCLEPAGGLWGHLSIYGLSPWTFSRNGGLRVVELFIWWLSSKKEDAEAASSLKG